ncbi:Peptidoglycan/LPS O-acetylase OafA/YrhL, contains acyltransferase and SGNH-hydrolase domains [Colwellia chukchiensis]|uniref:Peptidoglycan/LPS O-acetylase OafA/YrhL, contains acyltransferase and SGNH-hydrolase domains n=1 Tax=Colwellia chukchiensis TaxID=641665 RepID=A0A1H7SF60_9GAMM|nr:acyltransferase [Colwellia chukchiensis]SEL70816.1 Peptidoglycan/LPS O-acetylase OafA/YrhL, contains acyltransferase and SGNH-hydrolase domains [Colwellia chukchiensis]
MYLSNVINSKDNNFNLMRMLAAFAVLFSHSYALATGDAENEPLRTIIGITPGHIAVDIFFITSGLLVTRSLFYRRNLIEFAVARVLRIYPGLIVAVITCILIGALVSSLTINEYFTSKHTFIFLFKNSFMLLGDVQELPGVFLNAPFDNSVNGSLWTLPWELKMYAMLGLFGFITLLFNFIYKTNWLTFFILAFFVFSLVNYFEYHFFTDIRGQKYKLFRFGTLFFYGALMYLARRKIQLNKNIFWLSLVILAFSSFSHGLFLILYTLILPYIILYLAYVPAGRVRNYNRFGDYSYGIYIYAWPVQQLIATSIANVSSTAMIILSAIMTFFLAYASWHLIESKAVKLKKYVKHYPIFNIDNKPLPVKLK